MNQQRTRQKQAAGATKHIKAEVKGELVEFAWQLKKDGYADSGVKIYTKIIRLLVKRNVNVFNPEDVKKFLAEQNLNSTWKRNIITAYTTFLRKNGFDWQPLACDVIRKLPFIPTEKELDDLIASCGKKMATFL